MGKTRVLFLMPEITPYVEDNHISNIGRFLPQGIQEKGKEIRTFMPRYGCINERRNQLHEVIRLSGMNLIIDEADHPLIIKVASIQLARLQVYFIDNEDYFQRKFKLNDENGTFFDDNDERAIFFTRGVLETVKKLSWVPDIIHCHGWMTSTVPIYIKKAFKNSPIFSNSKIVYTVYENERFEGSLNERFGKKLIMPGIEAADVTHLENPTFDNVNKFAIDNSDAIIQGSETISADVLNYIQASEKPFLAFKDKDNYIAAYNDFYDTVMATEPVLCE